jgi:FG-GAP-like repeat/FG-GAP repeat
MKRIGYFLLLVIFFDGLVLAASHPVPLVDQPLVPDAAIPGAAGFTLKVHGAGFLSSSVVNWSGSALKTHFVSSTELTAKVPSSDLSKPGTATVSVVNPGSRVSNVSYFQIVKPKKSASLQFATYGTGSEPYAVAVGDFNGDGKLDLVVPNVSATTVSILLGNGDGTFQTQSEYQAGYAPIAVGVADLNGDGRLDLAVVNNGNDSNGHPGTVTILLGNGDGSFTTGKAFNTGNGPNSVAVGDFNGDGRLDLALSNYNIARGNSVTVLLGKGDGTFRKYVTYQTGSAPEYVATADLNGDGILDLVTANEVADTVSVLLGKGDGTFQPNVDYTVGKDPIALAIADLNRDGKPDLAVVDLGSDLISVLLGKGDGTFGAHVDYATGSFPVSIAIADFNADNIQDLAVANQNNAGTVSILFGKGNGTFKTHKDFSAGSQPQGIAVGDFNGDGRLDLAIVDVFSTEVGVLLQGK